MTDQEWLFCYQFLLTGDHVASLLSAYPTLAGRTRARLFWQAKQVLARPAVDTELQKLRLELRSSQRLTLEQHLHMLAELRDKSASVGQFSAAARCEELRGRAAGLYIEKVLIREEGGSREEIMARVLSIMTQNPRLAEVLEKAVAEKRQPVESRIVHEAEE